MKFYGQFRLKCCFWKNLCKRTEADPKSFRFLLSNHKSHERSQMLWRQLVVARYLNNSAKDRGFSHLLPSF